MDGRRSAQAIRKLEETFPPSSSEPGSRDPGFRVEGRIPIIAVSASLQESEKGELGRDFDGWMLKPVDFKRMVHLLRGLSDPSRRQQDAYQKGHWERGGWLNLGELY